MFVVVTQLHKKGIKVATINHTRQNKDVMYMLRVELKDFMTSKVMAIV